MLAICFEITLIRLLLRYRELVCTEKAITWKHELWVSLHLEKVLKIS